jgi:hypothetical protein
VPCRPRQLRQIPSRDSLRRSHCLTPYLHGVGTPFKRKNGVTPFLARSCWERVGSVETVWCVDLACEEFVRLLTASGWNKARAARELALEPSVVTRYCYGTTKPSLTVLRLFAGLVGEPLRLPGEGEAAMDYRRGQRYLERWESDILATLRRLEPQQRGEVVAALRQIIEVIARPVVYRRASAGASPHLTPAEPAAPPAPPAPPPSTEVDDDEVVRIALAQRLPAMRLAGVPVPSPSPIAASPTGSTGTPGAAAPPGSGAPPLPPGRARVAREADPQAASPPPPRRRKAA